jgi:signal transduction histidine kinase
MNICNNEQMEIQIEDHGIGFPIDKMSDIGAFNQFNKEKLAQRGSGLGLITSMLIAQRHKGSLQINGATIGTTVKVIFPLSTQIIS